MGKVKHEDKVVKLSELKPHPKNPNIHPVDQIDAMVRSMDQYGQYYRIIVDENMVIICGHGKKMALEKKGETEAKVTVISGLTDNQKMKLLIEDNKIQSLSYTNYEKIEEIIKEVGELDVIGFPADYLESIITNNSIDNMGVDFATPAEKVDRTTVEKQENQVNEFDSIEAGIQKTTVIVCPHCGKEIAM